MDSSCADPWLTSEVAGAVIGVVVTLVLFRALTDASRTPRGEWCLRLSLSAVFAAFVVWHVVLLIGISVLPLAVPPMLVFSLACLVGSAASGVGRGWRMATVVGLIALLAVHYAQAWRDLTYD